MNELAQDDLDALARCFRLLAARGRQLRRAREMEKQPATSEAAVGLEPAGVSCVKHVSDHEGWMLANGG